MCGLDLAPLKMWAAGSPCSRAPRCLGAPAPKERRFPGPSVLCSGHSCQRMSINRMEEARVYLPHAILETSASRGVKTPLGGNVLCGSILRLKVLHPMTSDPWLCPLLGHTLLPCFCPEGTFSHPAPPQGARATQAPAFTSSSGLTTQISFPTQTLS